MANEPTPAQNTPNPADKSGTSLEKSNDKQENNQQLNPDIENNAGHAAAPGVVPTNKVNQPPAASIDPADIKDVVEEPTTAVKKEATQLYRLTKGKHRYTNENGEYVVIRAETPEAEAGIPLTNSQYDNLRDRFEPIRK